MSDQTIRLDVVVENLTEGLRIIRKIGGDDDIALAEDYTTRLVAAHNDVIEDFAQRLPGLIVVGEVTSVNAFRNIQQEIDRFLKAFLIGRQRGER